MDRNKYEVYNLMSSELQENRLINTLLYSLNPIVDEGKNAESMSSYLVRLANAHNVSVGILTSKMIIKHFKMNYSTNVYSGYSKHVNGLGEFSQTNVKILEELTGQVNLSNITLIKFKNVLSKMRLMKANRTWCPACLQQMKDTFHTPYEKLIWNISHYDYCVEHSTFLKYICEKCGKPQNIIHVNSRIGYCQYCFSWLGEIKTNSGHILADRNEEIIYKSMQVEELTNYFFNTSELKSKDYISSFIFINEELRKNNLLKHFSLTKLNIAEESLLRYSYGETIPQLGMLFIISRFLDIRLVDILSGRVNRISLKNFDLINQSKIINYKHIKHQKIVKSYLEDVIESQNDYISIVSLSEKINVSRKTLNHRFPELIKIIKEKNDRILQNVKKKKYSHGKDRERVFKELNKVLNSEEYKTIEQISSQLGMASTTLEKYFPEIMKEIKVKNKKIRKGNFKRQRGRGSNVPPRYKEMDSNRVQGQLESIAESIVKEPKYLNQIEKELGISQERLRRRFPDLINLINSKNKAIIKRKRIEYINKCNEELVNTITYLVSLDIYPGVDALQKYLSFKLNNPVYLTVWRKTLQELGINRKRFGN